MANSKELLQKKLILWQERDQATHKKILSAIIKNQEVFDESMAISCQKHGITKGVFDTVIGDHPELLERYNDTKYNMTRLSNADLSKLSLDTLTKILDMTYVERTEERWDAKKQKWENYKRFRSDPCELQDRTAKYLLERTNNDFNPIMKQMTVQTVLDIMKHLVKSSKLKANEVDALQGVLSNYLRLKGIEITKDDFEEDDIMGALE